MARAHLLRGVSTLALGASALVLLWQVALAQEPVLRSLRAGDEGVAGTVATPAQVPIAPNPGTPDFSGRGTSIPERLDNLSAAEQELLRQLYGEGERIDRADTLEERGEVAPAQGRAATDPAAGLDIFSGPAEGDLPDTLADNQRAGAENAPARPAAAAQFDPLRPGAESAGAEDGRAPAARVLPTAQTGATGLPGLSNPPLSAGTADETLGADSLLGGNARARALDRLIRPGITGDEDPFAPVGIRTGSFVLTSELEQSVGATTNINQDPLEIGGAFAQTDLSLRLVSDWAANEAEVNARLSYRRDFAGNEPHQPEATLDGRTRFDLSRDTGLTLRGAMRYYEDDPITTGAGGEEQPKILSASIAGEVDHRIGRATLAATGTLARRHYLDLPTDTNDDSYSTATLALRAGYDVSPALRPFVEASYGYRAFDEKGPCGPCNLLIDRDSHLPALRAGLAIDIAEKLRGEVSAGYAWSRPVDDKAIATGAPTLDASLTWSPRRGTDVLFAARTSFEPEDSGEAATTTYEASLGLVHALNARTSLNAALTGTFEDSTLPLADELSLAGEFGFSYWLNRTLALTGLYDYRRNFAEQRLSEWDAHTIRLGIKLQR